MTGAQFGGVDIDLLADYIGGALAGTPDEPVVAALVADDPAWRAAYASLGGGMELVGAALGRLGPEPMPAELAARLDAMFRAEVDSAPVSADQVVADPTPISADQAVADPTSISADLAAPPTPRLAPVQAAREPALDAIATDEPAEEVAGSPVAASGRHDSRGPADSRHDSRGPADSRHDSRGPADGRPGGRGDVLARRTGRRMRWATPIAVAAGLFAFVGFSLDYLAGRSADDASDAPASMAERDAGGAGDASGADSASAAAGATSAEHQILSTGTDYTLATLALEPPPRPLAAPEIDASQDRSTRQHQSSALAELGRLVAHTALNACLAAIEQANAAGPLSVSSVDYARFEGKPAVVVRFSATNGQWAWASGPECGAPGGGADTLGKVPVR